MKANTAELNIAVWLFSCHSGFSMVGASRGDCGEVACRFLRVQALTVKFISLGFKPPALVGPLIFLLVGCNFQF